MSEINIGGSHFLDEGSNGALTRNQDLININPTMMQYVYNTVDNVVVENIDIIKGVGVE